MDFLTAYRSFWFGYTDFKGTSTRPEFWMAFLINALISLAFYCLGIIPGAGRAFVVLGGVFDLATLVPCLAIGARRLHDCNQSAYNLFWLLLPVIGWIILIVFWCFPSTEQKYSGEAAAVAETPKAEEPKEEPKAEEKAEEPKEKKTKTTRTTKTAKKAKKEEK